jgi:hypothetical protein
VKVSVTVVMLKEFEVFPLQCEAHNNRNNEVNIRHAGQGTLLFVHDVFKDICLPKFTDPYKQNIVHFGAYRIHLS